MIINNDRQAMNANMQPTLHNTKPEKIEVIVGALTENDVKDHGTTTGVVKTVNKQVNKMRPHITRQLEDIAQKVRDPGNATEVVGNIKIEATQNPSSLILAQANQVEEVVLQLLQ